MQPSGIGGTNWSPVPYSPTPIFLRARHGAHGARSPASATSTCRGCATPGEPVAAHRLADVRTFTAIEGTTNKIAWQHRRRTASAGRRLVGHGGRARVPREPDGNFLALDAKTGKELWRFQTASVRTRRPCSTRWTASSTSRSRTGGNQLQGSAYGDAVWAFSLKDSFGPMWPPAGAADRRRAPPDRSSQSRRGQGGCEQRGTARRRRDPDQDRYDRDFPTSAICALGDVDGSRQVGPASSSRPVEGHHLRAAGNTTTSDLPTLQYGRSLSSSERSGSARCRPSRAGAPRPGAPITRRARMRRPSISGVVALGFSPSARPGATGRPRSPSATATGSRSC